MIISVSGFSGCGKTTATNVLHYKNAIDRGMTDVFTTDFNYNPFSTFTETSWAKKMKKFIADLLGVPVEKLDDQEFKKTLLPETWRMWGITRIDSSRVLFFPCTKEQAREHSEAFPGSKMYSELWTVRQLLQKLGTPILIGMVHSDIHVIGTLASYKEDQDWIINDTRFPNEFKGIKRATGKDNIFICVHRPGIVRVSYLGEIYYIQAVVWSESAQSNVFLLTRDKERSYKEYTISLTCNNNHIEFLDAPYTDSSETSWFDQKFDIYLNTHTIEDLRKKLIEKFTPKYEEKSYAKNPS